MATVRITAEAEKQLEKIPAGMLPRMHNLIERLKNWPKVSGAKPLRGRRFGQFRLRSGDYRMIVQPRGDIIYVLQVGNRKDVYED